MSTTDRPSSAINDQGDEAVIGTPDIRWQLVEEAVRGFLFEKHVPLDTADEWVDEIVQIAREQIDTADPLAELRELVGWMDDHLDADVAETYQGQPLAQDWARVAKVGEEAGEAIDALIGITGQNPRKGHYGQLSDLLDELADVALTGLYAMQHFTKNRHETVGLLMDRARYHRQRVENGSRERHADPSQNGSPSAGGES